MQKFCRRESNIDHKPAEFDEKLKLSTRKDFVEGNQAEFDEKLKLSLRLAKILLKEVKHRP